MIAEIYIKEAVEIKREAEKVDSYITRANRVLDKLHKELAEAEEERERLQIEQSIFDMRLYIDECKIHITSRVEDLRKRISDRHPEVSADDLIQIMSQHLTKNQK